MYQIAQLFNIMSCSCSAEGKTCRQNICSYKSAGLSCADYCVCEAGEVCCNPLTIHDEDVFEDEEEDSNVGEAAGYEEIVFYYDSCSFEFFLR